MSQSNSNSQKPIHHLVQLSYATSLFSGQNVLLAGRDLSLASFIAQAGADVVAVGPQSPEPPWPRLRASKNVAHHVMPLENLSFEDGVFGAAVIPNLSDIENPEAVLAEMRRVLASFGHLIAATPNPEITPGASFSAVDYYKMYELLSGHFSTVQMIGQSAFNGYAVVELSNEDGELEVSFNSELLGNEAEEIAWFAAVCGNKRAVLDPYAIIQVPATATPAGSEASPKEIEQLQEELKNTKLELGNRGVRIESLEKKLEEELMQSEAARARAVKLAKEFDNERKAVTKKALEDEYSKRSADIDLNGTLHNTKKELRQAEDRAQSAEAARDELIDRMRSDAAELERLRDKMDELKSRSQQPTRDPEAEKKVRAAEERARSAEAARDELIDHMRSDATELDRLKKQHDAASSKIETLQESNSKLQSELRDIEHRFAETEELLARKNASETTFKPGEELLALEKENQALEKRLALMAERKRVAEEEAGRRTVIVRDLVVKMENMSLVEKEAAVSPAVLDASEKVAALENEVAALRGTKAGEHRARVEAELESAGRILEVEKLKNALDELNVQLKARDEELTRMVEQKKASEKSRQVESDENSELYEKQEMRIAEMESELQSAKWRIDELCARKDDLEKQLTDAAQEAQALQTSFSEKQRNELKNAEDMQAMKGRLLDAEAENQRLSAALESVKRRERMLDGEVESLTARSQNLRADLDESLARVESLTANLSAIGDDREQMTQSLHRLTEQLDAEKKERLEVEEALGVEKRETALSRSKLQSAEVELKGAHEKISDLSKIADSLKDESGRLAEVLDALDRRQAETASLREQLATSGRQLEEETSCSESLRSELDSVKAALSAESEMTRLAGADAARASGEAASLQARLKQSAAAVLARDAEVEATLSVIAELREDVVRLDAKLREVRENEKRVDELNRQMEALKEEADRLSGLSSAMDADFENRASRLTKEEAALTEREAELGRKSSMLVEKESRLSELESSLVEKEAELNESVSTIAEKEARLSEQESLFQEKTQTLDELRSKEQSLQAELEERTRELDESTAALSEMEAKIDAVNQSKVGLSVELADAIQNSERLATELAGIREKESSVKEESDALKAKLDELSALNQAHEHTTEEARQLSRDLELHQKGLGEKESLIASLTEQLEERERRAAKLERQNRLLTEQIQEHEGDLSAWDMELKLRSARISQLEKELQAAKAK